MNTTSEGEALYRECERAFLTTIAQSMKIVIARHSEKHNIEDNKLLSELTFAVAAHLSGSSFGGNVNGDEIYPKLGFWIGEQDEKLHLANGSELTDFIADVLIEITETQEP